MQTEVLVFLFIAWFAAVPSGWERSIPSEEKVKPLLAIDLETNFQNDSVRVLVDNRIVFDRTATTCAPGMLDFAERILPDVDAGIHCITVYLRTFGLKADTTISVRDTVGVGVLFDRNSKTLTLAVFHDLPLYD